MVREKVEKTMKKALLAFSQKAGKDVTALAFFVHTKPTKEEPELMPKYFYTVDGKPVLEDGKLKDLDFVRDILGKKFDLLGMGAMASQFFMQFFNKESRETESDPKSLYVGIQPMDEDLKELGIALYKDGAILKNMKLDEIFGE